MEEVGFVRRAISLERNESSVATPGAVDVVYHSHSLLMPLIVSCV